MGTPWLPAPSQLWTSELLSTGWLPFAFATAAMVALIGGQMMRGAPARWIVLLELAILTGLGSQFLFTEVFVTPLP